MKRLALPTILLAVGALLASGCVYKMNIQQGNYLVAESVSQLKEGMTRSQVRFLLGTPMVPDAFNEDRWDYYYFFSSQKFKTPLKRRLTVYFTDEKVQRFENLGVPTQADLEQLERDLRKAIADNKKNNKQGFWKRTFSRNKSSSEPASTSAPTAADSKPDPVPPSEPVPAPAGTPSGPT
ncbi:MAG: outer membrane protein assembly factor BamE [Pseudomonadota bacterium]